MMAFRIVQLGLGKESDRQSLEVHFEAGQFTLCLVSFDGYSFLYVTSDQASVQSRSDLDRNAGQFLAIRIQARPLKVDTSCIPNDPIAKIAWCFVSRESDANLHVATDKVHSDPRDTTRANIAIPYRVVMAYEPYQDIVLTQCPAKEAKPRANGRITLMHLHQRANVHVLHTCSWKPHTIWTDIIPTTGMAGTDAKVPRAVGKRSISRVEYVDKLFNLAEVEREIAASHEEWPKLDPNLSTCA